MFNKKNLIIDDKYKTCTRVSNYDELKDFYNDLFEKKIDMNHQLDIDIKSLCKSICEKMVKEHLYLNDILNVLYRNILHNLHFISYSDENIFKRLIIDYNFIDFYKAYEFFLKKSQSEKEILSKGHEKIINHLSEDYNKVKETFFNLTLTEDELFTEEQYKTMYKFIKLNEKIDESKEFISYIIFLDVATVFNNSLVIMMGTQQNNFKNELIAIGETINSNSIEKFIDRKIH